jgi:prophage antirepressor-like protein
MTTARLDKDEFSSIEVVDSIGKRQECIFVTEAGLYSLALGSRKPEAREFKRWVTHDVLPAIRKHGMYATPTTVEAMLADPDTMIQTLQALKEERAAKLEAQAKLAIAAPKAEFYDTVTASDDLLPMDRVAKLLNIGGIGRNMLFRILRNRSVLRSNNDPYQEYVDRGYFTLRETRGYYDRNDEYHPTYKTYATQKGLDWIRRMIVGGESA